MFLIITQFLSDSIFLNAIMNHNHNMCVKYDNFQLKIPSSHIRFLSVFCVLLVLSVIQIHLSLKCLLLLYSSYLTDFLLIFMQFSNLLTHYRFEY